MFLAQPSNDGTPARPFRRPFIQSMRHTNAHGPNHIPPPMAAWLWRLPLAFSLLALASGTRAQCPTEIEVVEPISCSGADDAVLSVTVPDGIDPTDVYWLLESDTLFGAVQSGLGPGSYLAFVPGCSALGINVNEPFPFFITAEVDQLPTCDSPCSGVVTATPNFGQGPFTYSWSHDAAQTGSTGAGVCEQLLLVTATDVNGCVDDVTVTVEIPPVEVLTFSTDPSCNGFDDGTASAVATGGVGGGFTFEWTTAGGAPAGSGADLTDLPAGTYIVTATDTGGCSLSNSATLTDPPAVDVEVNTTPVSCFGDADGSATATFATATFYAWTGPNGYANAGPSLDAVSDLAPGSYTVFVTADDGCVGEGTAEVAEPQPVAAEPFFAPPACPGDFNGTVGIVPTGGAPTYDVLWTLPTGATLAGEFLNAVPAGTYDYALEDANGCAVSGSVTLEDPAPLSVTILATLPSCAEGPGSDDGVLEANVEGGVPPYLAAWAEPATLDVIATGLVASNLTAGPYGFGVMDLAGCQLDTLVILSAPDGLQLDLTAANPTCFGESDGLAEAMVTGGTPGYTVTWSGNVPNTIASNLMDLGAGDYVVTATDGNGCMADSAFALVEPAALDVTLTSVPAGCEENDGSAVAVVSGGLPDYTLEWTGPNGPAGDAASLDSLTPGAYQLDVTDANGCTATGTTEVTQLPPLAWTVDWAVVDCETGAGELTWSAEGGDAPLTPVLLGESGDPVDPAMWSALSPGTYGFSVEDARGCMLDTAFTLDPALSLEAEGLPAGCGGLGAVTASVTGGAGAVNWALTPDATSAGSDGQSAEWAGLPAGDYTVTADDGTCTASANVTVDGVDLFDWMVEAVDFACAVSPGAISIALTGGVEPIAYSGMLLDGGVSWASPDTVGLSAGEYVLNVTDAAGCVRDTTIELAAVDPVMATATVAPISCQGAADGAIEFAAMGGTEPLTFGAQGPSGTIEAPLDNLAPGTYVAGVVDGRGCTADSTVVLTDPAGITAVVTAVSESCPGTADGQAEVSASGGSGTLLVEWANGPQDSLWSNLTAGDYAWTVTDTAGCDASGTVTVEVGLGPVVLDTVLSGTCEGGVPSSVVELFVAGTASDVEVLLGGLPADVTAMSDTGSTWSWLDLAEGNYGWSVSFGGACSTMGNVDVTLANALEWIGTVTPPTCEGDSGSVVGITSGGSGLIQTTWTGVTVDGDTLGGDFLFTGPVPAGEYTFMANDDGGCAIDTTVSLAPLSSGLMLTSNVIQPSCGGALAGEATLLSSGGLPPYDIVVEGAEDSLFIPFLLPGSYPATLTDSAGCTTADTVVVDPASAFTLSAVVDSASCSNSEDGQIVLLPMDATGSVDFTFVGPFGATPAGDTIPNLAAGIYEITALDSAGCPSALLVAVGAPDPVVVTLDSLDRPSCVGDADGALAVNATGGSGDPLNWTVAWTLDGEEFESGAGISGLGEGTYAVVVTDSAGCTGDIESIPLVAEGDVMLSVPSDTVLCSGTPLTLEAEATGASTTTWAIVDTLGGAGLTAAVNAVDTGLSVWVFSAARLGCVRTDSVEVVGLSLPTLDAGADEIVPEGGVTGIGAFGNPAWSYSWSPAEELEDAGAPATITQPLFQTTDFVLTATTVEGCSATDTMTVEVLLELDIPSGFTPNDDGINDRWNLGGLGQYPSAEITVFNRWGDILFTQDATEAPWDGTLNGIPLPVGTYYYFIRVSEPALQAEWTGPITLMR